MEAYRFLDADELTTLLSQANNRLADYGVGFVRLERHGAAEEAVLAGSGTLVKVGNTHAILTADHVLANLPASGPVGLVLNLRPESRLHRFLIYMDAVERRQIAKASGDANGPDLAAIILPPNTAAELLARVSFYDLQTRRPGMLSDPPPLEHGGWILYGFVEERSARAPGEYGFSEVKHFTSVCGGGVVTSEDQRDGFDYLNFRVKYGEKYEGPECFEGVSGGALWQVLARINDGAIAMADPLLSGVPFFQTAISADARTIVCHGRRSLYDVVVGALT